jgi:hypothetical protein
MSNSTSRIVLLVVGLFLSNLSFAYQAIDLNIGRSVAFGYSTNLDQEGFGAAASGLIGIDEDTRLFAPALRYTLIPIDNESFLDNVYVTVAGYWAWLDQYDDSTVAALGFGGGGRIKVLDEYSTLGKPIYLAGTIGYAPPGTTYQDGENFLYWNLRFEYPVFDRSLVYLGYRWITADIETDKHRHIENASIDKTVFVGIHYVF